jgi:hypothetical protein
MDPRVTPYLIAALVVWALYRRMRRSFGRQRVRDGSMWVRIGVFSVVAVLTAVSIAHDLPVLAALLGGIVGGAVLGYFGLRHTKFEVTPEGRFYTPHAYIGLVVAALLVGRLLYRFLDVYNGGIPAGAMGQHLDANYLNSPFTLAVLGALVGYYVLYYLGVLQRTKSSPSAARQAGSARAQGQ